MFMVYLRAFRDNLKRYNLDKLSEYFEDYYLKEERIKQWACWYRAQMFDCEWILDTNMHVEAWHDILKSHIMGRKKNIRIDKLLKILRSAETNYFWKWTRIKVGIRVRADERWLRMRGEDTSPESVTKSRCSVDCTYLEKYDGVLEYEDRSTLFKERLKECLTDCADLISQKAVDSARLKTMVQQLTVIRNVLRNAPVQVLPAVKGPAQERLQTTDKRKAEYVPVAGKKQGKMLKQPRRFKKRRTKTTGATSIKSLHKDVNRTNVGLSMRFGAVGWDSLRAPETFPDTSELRLELPVVRKGSTMTLGGIIFLPVIAGMVVPDSGTSFGFEVLNMRVGSVYVDSAAGRGGVHRMHYLYKLSTQRQISSRRVQSSPDQVIGSIAYRHMYFNTLHFDKITHRVDSILTDAYTRKSKVLVTLLSYT